MVRLRKAFQTAGTATHGAVEVSAFFIFLNYQTIRTIGSRTGPEKGHVFQTLLRKLVHQPAGQQFPEAALRDAGVALRARNF